MVRVRVSSHLVNEAAVRPGGTDAVLRARTMGGARTVGGAEGHGWS